MKNYDVCCFTGNWPFRKIHKGKMSDLIAEHKKNGISGGLVGCLDSVFYNDPVEGDEEVCNEIIAAGYSFAAAANPTLTGAIDDLDIIRNKLHASAVRLYPSDHLYSLKSPEVVEYCKKAGEMGLRVIITVRTEDIRIDYCFKQGSVAVAELAYLAKECPGTKFLFSNIFIGEIFAIADAVNSLDNVWVDMARFNHYLFALEKTLEKIKAEKIIFGSGFPLLTMKCMLLNVEFAEIPEATKSMIMSENYERFMK